MCKETFFPYVSPILRRTNTVLRRPLSIERRAAVTLCCLVTPAEYRTIAHLFGIAYFTACEIAHVTFQCNMDILMHERVQLIPYC